MSSSYFHFGNFLVISATSFIDFGIENYLSSLYLCQILLKIFYSEFQNRSYLINKKEELEKKVQEKKLAPETVNLVDNTERVDNNHAFKSGKSMYIPGFLSKLKTTNKEEIPGNFFLLE